MLCVVSLANDNFFFSLFKAPPPPPHLRVFIFFKHPSFYFHFFGGTPNFSSASQQVFVNAFLRDCQIIKPHPPSLLQIIFRVKSFLCLSHMLSWTLLLFFLSFLSFLVILITIRSPTRAVLCCLVRRRSSIPTPLPPTASSSTWTKLSIGTARMYGKWKLFSLTASLQIKTSKFKNTCERKPHGTGHQHPT